MEKCSYEFDEGYNHFGPMSLEADCPYPDNTDEQSLWLNGYHKAENEYLNDAFGIEEED